MAATQVLFYCEPESTPPVLDWLQSLPEKQRLKAEEVVGLLASDGHELRRPHADILRDGIYELRVTTQHQQNRILYFFHGRGLVVLAHGLKKEAKIPREALEFALRRREKYVADPPSFGVEVEF
jgi:phage-related protein